MFQLNIMLLNCNMLMMMYFADLQMVNLSLRVLARPDERLLPEMYQELGLDYDERVLPSICNEVCKKV